jgi:hypothetical protein
MQFGRWLARRWRGYRRCEDKILLWLKGAGFPIKVSRVLAWLLKAVVVIALLYVAFWITIIAIAAIVGAYKVLRTDEDSPEWRDGPEGHGYYEKGARTDFGRLFQDDE